MRFALPELHGLLALIAWCVVALVLVLALLGLEWLVLTVRHDLRESASRRHMAEALSGLTDEDDEGEQENERSNT